MKIILPRLLILFVLLPMLLVVFAMLSIVIFIEFNAVFILSFTSLIYVYGVYSYSITIKDRTVYAKDNLFKIRKDKITIDEIIDVKVYQQRSGISYLKLIGKDTTVSIFRTYFSKTQLTKLKDFINQKQER